jgi:hypothetical protein
MNMMSEQEIVDRANAFDISAELVNGKAWYYETFECDEEREPHDVAWDIKYWTNAVLRPIGLELAETWNDNDSCGGRIVPIGKDP